MPLRGTFDRRVESILETAIINPHSVLDYVRNGGGMLVCKLRVVFFSPELVLVAVLVMSLRVCDPGSTVLRMVCGILVEGFLREQPSNLISLAIGQRTELAPLATVSIY